MSETDTDRVKQPHVYESRQSLHVYAAIIEAGKPLTVRELIDRTNIADGTLYPLLQKRVHAGIVVDGKRDGTAEFDLTHDGYRLAKSILLELEVGVAAWLRAEQRFTCQGLSQT